MNTTWNGARLKEIRKAAGLGQVALGEMIGEPQAMISQWESDRRKPGAEQYMKLCVALRVSMETMQAAVGSPIRFRRKE